MPIRLTPQEREAREDEIISIIGALPAVGLRRKEMLCDLRNKVNTLILHALTGCVPTPFDELVNDAKESA